MSGAGVVLAVLAGVQDSGDGLQDLGTGRRLPDHVEVAAYYAVSEALANAIKHARALAPCRSNSTHWIQSCGWRSAMTGSAEPPRQGVGSDRLRDRVEALGGTLDVTSPHQDIGDRYASCLLVRHAAPLGPLAGSVKPG